MEQALGGPLLWLACLHHILELVLHEALTQKLGPTLGPTEKYFTRFESYFNSMKKEEVEEIRKGATARLNLLSPEDEVTKEFFESSHAFFANFMSKSNGFQRDDYGEFAHLIMVREFL